VRIGAAVLPGILLLACDARSPNDVGLAIEDATNRAAAAVVAPANVVEITSTGMNIDMPASIPSGWTTFRFDNRSSATHFVVLERMPAGRTVEDSRAEVVPVFDAAMDLILAGDAAAGFAEFAKLPAWFFEVAFVGGPGLTAPGTASLTTLYLEPGTYVVECYFKMPDGTFHSSMGMIEGLTVTPAASSVPEPKATLAVRIAGDGIEILGEPRPGLQTIGVHFDEQMAHEHFLGHDVHLARLADDTDLAALSAWMNWSAPAGLASPAPVEFIGGTQEMPAGQTAYITALLTPGRYALIAEVPDPLGKGMLRTFTVPTSRHR
jgi:hypothetical protein